MNIKICWRKDSEKKKNCLEKTLVEFLAQKWSMVKWQRLQSFSKC